MCGTHFSGRDSPAEWAVPFASGDYDHMESFPGTGAGNDR